MKSGRHSGKTKAAKQVTVRKYTNPTLKLLWGRAAGRCSMPECRVELFADATDYDPVVVIGEMGHVAAAGKLGPRHDPTLTAEERDHYKNLILLCQHCHGKVDGQPGFYSVQRLHAIKDQHEAWVRASLPARGKSTTGWTGVSLEGDHPLDLQTVDEAISPDFIKDTLVRIRVPSDTAEWQAVDNQLQKAAADLLVGGEDFEKRLAIFPIAPVSACIALGYHLTSRPHVRGFQLHRDTRNWSWPKRQEPTNDIEPVGPVQKSDAAALAILFSFSAEITEDMLKDVIPADIPRIHIRIEKPSVNWLSHPQQIAWAGAAARDAFEAAIANHPKAKLWYMFYAGPAPVAVAIGQQLNPTMVPPVQLYEFRAKKFPQYEASIRLDS